MNFNTNRNGEYLINAWDYMDRMALYKNLIENVKHCEWTNRIPSKAEIDPSILIEKFNLGSILWGLPLQHGWQLSSGRLMNAADR